MNKPPAPSVPSAAPASATSEPPLPKVMEDLVTVVHRLRDAGMNLEQIKAALKAHAAKRNQAPRP